MSRVARDIGTLGSSLRVLAAPCDAQEAAGSAGGWLCRSCARHDIAADVGPEQLGVHVREGPVVVLGLMRVPCRVGRTAALAGGASYRGDGSSTRSPLERS